MEQVDKYNGLQSQLPNKQTKKRKGLRITSSIAMAETFGIDISSITGLGVKWKWERASNFRHSFLNNMLA
jgi:hypothetical protein